MTESLVFGKQGYKDWKRTSQSIPRHKKSAVHREAMIKLLQRSDAGCRVDAEISVLHFTTHFYFIFYSLLAKN
jgi:hypothetical protein